jgi:acetyl esterase/lipase
MRARPLLAASLAALLLAGCQATYFRAVNLGVDRGETRVFDAAAGLSADVYRPAGGGHAAPVVVFLYGGSWQNGQRGYYRFVGRALAGRGFVVVVPDYRKAPAHPFPAFMHDAAAATAWVRGNARAFGGDPARVFLMGHSAGAQIAALLGTDARYLRPHGLRPRDLAGVVGLAGPYDYTPDTPALQQALGPARGWRDTQPLRFVDGDEPPFLLLHGDRDRTVDPGNADRLATALRARGVAVQAQRLPGVGHVALVNGFRSVRASPVLSRTADWMRARSPAGTAHNGGRTFTRGTAAR